MRSAGLTRTATCRVARGIDEATGEVLPARLLATRVGYLAGLVAECGQVVLDARWDTTSIEAICASQAPDGTRLPRQGRSAASKLWGPTPLPAGIKGSSRVGDMGAELAARQLRSAGHRLRTYAVLLAGGLPADCPDAVSGEAMRRRIGRRLDRGVEPPESLFDLEPEPPRVPALIPLEVCDQAFLTALTGPNEQAAHAAVDIDLAERRRHHAAQMAHRRRITHNSLGDDAPPPRRPATSRQADTVLVVRMQLPLVTRPASKPEWSWHRLVLLIPKRYRTGTCSPPALRVTDATTIRADVAVTLPTPQRTLEDGQRPVRVLGVDWGVRRLLSATVVRAIGPLGGDGCYANAAVDGRPLFFQAGELQGKARRTGEHRARLQAKTDQWVLLAGGLPEGDSRRVELEARCGRAQAELADLAAAQRNLNEQIARLGARWLTEQALAAGCQAIALENLITLEHRGLGKRNNERCSLALRGKITAYTRQAAQEAGLAIITVNARGTSSRCPRCDHQLTHLRCPGGTLGHAWAWCDQCGYSADRDHAASENVGQRAVTPAAKPVRHKPTRRRDLHPASRTRHRPRRARRLVEINEQKRRPPPMRPSNITRTSSLTTDGGRAGQVGPAAVRLVIPSPNPAAGEGHRSTGPGPRCERQAGHTKMHGAIPPTRLDGLLSAYRTALRATPVLYRKIPWAGAPGRRKKA